MNKKAYFYTLHLLDSMGNTEFDYKMIPEILRKIINENAIENRIQDRVIKTLNVTPEGEQMHVSIDIFDYENEILFMRASKQRPTGSVIGRDYATWQSNELLPGVTEAQKGIELYTYIYINYEKCIAEIIFSTGAPNENVISDIIKKYSFDYSIQLNPVPNTNGIEKIYGKENIQIGSISLTLDRPDPAILGYVIGQKGNEILQSMTDSEIKVAINVQSSFSRSVLLDGTEEANGVIDSLREILYSRRILKAKMRAKVKDIKTRDFNFYEESFYYPVDIPSYHLSGTQRVYYRAIELIDINYRNLVQSFIENKEFVCLAVDR